MRRIVCVEGRPQMDTNALIIAGALCVEVDQVPVMTGNPEGTLVGWAEDIQRNDVTGAVTMNFHFTDKEFKPEENLEPMLYTSPLEYTTGRKRMYVYHAVINAIVFPIMPGRPYPVLGER